MDINPTLGDGVDGVPACVCVSARVCVCKGDDRARLEQTGLDGPPEGMRV